MEYFLTQSIIIIILGILFFKYIKKSYKVYNAVITQKSGDNPTEDYVLENTIGKLVYTRISSGIFNINLKDAFPENKIIVFTSPDFYGRAVRWDRLDNSNIILKQSKANLNFTRLSIEIRVYK
jgi:hypothetical protein